jgi:hypothetical protein
MASTTSASNGTSLGPGHYRKASNPTTPQSRFFALSARRLTNIVAPLTVQAPHVVEDHDDAKACDGHELMVTRDLVGLRAFAGTTVSSWRGLEPHCSAKRSAGGACQALDLG